MYQIKRQVKNNYEIYELHNTESESWLKVVPERGGIIIGLGFKGKELLYLNEETLFNEHVNVRGGIPILFPISGQLENGRYELDGKTYEMKNHGVARNNKWEVINTTTDEQLSITIKLNSTTQTKISYPFDFEVLYTYVLEENKLSIIQEYQNNSDTAMPIYAGFHPYFKTNNKVVKIDSDAETYLDYNDKRVSTFNGEIDLKNKKEAVVLLDTRRNEVVFGLNETGIDVKMEYGKEFKYVVLWTEANQDFVCVEPWMAKTNELNRKDELHYIPSMQSLKTELHISV